MRQQRAFHHLLLIQGGVERSFIEPVTHYLRDAKKGVCLYAVLSIPSRVRYIVIGCLPRGARSIFE